MGQGKPLAQPRSLDCKVPFPLPLSRPFPRFLGPPGRVTTRHDVESARSVEIFSWNLSSLGDDKFEWLMNRPEGIHCYQETRKLAKESHKTFEKFGQQGFTWAPIELIRFQN